MSRVVRPIVRSFTKQHAKRCAAHVRGGGHAVFWEAKSRAFLVLPVPNEEDASDLSLFSILDIGKQRWTVSKTGVFKGLALCLVPRDCHAIVTARVWRDSVFPGPTRVVNFDCLKCGACCKDNEVILQEHDIQRFVEVKTATICAVTSSARSTRCVRIHAVRFRWQAKAACLRAIPSLGSLTARSHRKLRERDACSVHRWQLRTRRH
jgi:hypothetical protein